MTRVQGHCPMGCGETLFLGVGGHVTCARLDCPRPTAVDELLAQPETEHMATISEDGFTVEHPLRERLDGALHECDLHQQLQAAGGPPAKPGRYRVTRHYPDPISESYRPGDLAGWDFEAVS